MILARWPATRSWSVPAALVAALAVAVVAGIAVGSRSLPLADVLRVLVTPDGSEASLVVHDLRLPRTLVGLAVGAALGVAGAQLQGLTRNPLADPGLLGVAAGAALGVVVATTVLPAPSALARSGAARRGGRGAGAGVAALAGPAATASRPRDGGTLDLVLAGVAVTAVLSAVTTVLVLLDADTLDAYRFWAVGSIAGRDLAVLVGAAPVLVAGAVLAVVGVRGLDSLALGDDLARGLGTRVARTRAVVVGSATLLTAGAVAVAGPIVFVGLVVPHVARALVGPSHARLLPASALVGAAFVVLAGVVGRVAARPGELQVGIVTALLGAPVLVWLVQRSRLAAA